MAPAGRWLVQSNSIWKYQESVGANLCVPSVMYTHHSSKLPWSNITDALSKRVIIRATILVGLLPSQVEAKKNDPHVHWGPIGNEKG